MTDHRKALRAKLLAKAEATIDNLLSDKRLHEKMTLSQIEDVVGKSELDFRQKVLEEVIGIQEAKCEGCPKCGGQVKNKGKRQKQVISLRGEVEIERSYQECQACGHRYFPPR